MKNKLIIIKLTKEELDALRTVIDNSFQDEDELAALCNNNKEEMAATLSACKKVDEAKLASPTK